MSHTISLKWAAALLLGFGVMTALDTAMAQDPSKPLHKAKINPDGTVDLPDADLEKLQEELKARRGSCRDDKDPRPTKPPDALYTPAAEPPSWRSWTAAETRSACHELAASALRGTLAASHWRALTEGHPTAHQQLRTIIGGLIMCRAGALRSAGACEPLGRVPALAGEYGECLGITATARVFTGARDEPTVRAFCAQFGGPERAVCPALAAAFAARDPDQCTPIREPLRAFCRAIIGADANQCPAQHATCRSQAEAFIALASPEAGDPALCDRFVGGGFAEWCANLYPSSPPETSTPELRPVTPTSAAQPAVAP